MSNWRGPHCNCSDVHANARTSQWVFLNNPFQDSSRTLCRSRSSAHRVCSLCPVKPTCLQHSQLKKYPQLAHAQSHRVCWNCKTCEGEQWFLDVLGFFIRDIVVQPLSFPHSSLPSSIRLQLNLKLGSVDSKMLPIRDGYFAERCLPQKHWVTEIKNNYPISEIKNNDFESWSPPLSQLIGVGNKPVKMSRHFSWAHCCRRILATTSQVSAPWRNWRSIRSRVGKDMQCDSCNLPITMPWGCIIFLIYLGLSIRATVDGRNLAPLGMYRTL